MTSNMKGSTSDASVVQVTTKDGVKFGKGLRDKEFLFGKGHLNLNHGMAGIFYMFCGPLLIAMFVRWAFDF